jgi:CDP-diacylglycerol--glycerol-3-phosphate 3-phosphatidyltransferase
MATATPNRQPPVFNLPNQLTASRLVLGLVLFVFIDHGDIWVGCILLFALAATTDWLDGYLARKQGLVSTLGRNLDPLVDKVVVCGAYIFLLPVNGAGLLPWMVTVVVGRELVITGLRSFMENRGASFGADWLGKVKMVLQCGALFAIFVALQAAASNADSQPLWDFVRDAFIWSMLLATALSGLQYLWRAVMVLKMDVQI